MLGSGQLGRMFTIAARRLGYRVHIYSPDSDTPAGQVGDVEFVAPYEDLERVRDFARGVSVVTFEFENVPSATSRACAEIVPVRPDGEVLLTDGGHYILDAHLGAIAEPERLAQALNMVPGVVEHGLFIGLAAGAILAGAGGLTILGLVE